MTMTIREVFNSSKVKVYITTFMHDLLQLNFQKKNCTQLDLIACNLHFNLHVSSWILRLIIKFMFNLLKFVVPNLFKALLLMFWYTHYCAAVQGELPLLIVLLMLGGRCIYNI